VVPALAWRAACNVSTGISRSDDATRDNAHLTQLSHESTMIAGSGTVDDSTTVAGDAACIAPCPAERPSAFIDPSAIVTSSSVAAASGCRRGCAFGCTGMVGASRHIGHVSRPAIHSTPGSLRSFGGGAEGAASAGGDGAIAVGGGRLAAGTEAWETDAFTVGGADR
jgi:hypothetical protein